MASIEQAEAWIRAGRPAEALAAAQALARSNPADVRAIAVLANAAIALGDLETAAAALHRLLALRPVAGVQKTLATVLNNRGRARRARGERTPALQDFRTAAQLQPSHPQAWYNLALTAAELGDAAQAAAAIAQHRKLAPDDAEAALFEAELLGGAPAQAFIDALPRERLPALDPAALAALAARVDRPEAALEALRRLSPEHDLRKATTTLAELALAGEVQAAKEGARGVIAVRRRAGRSTLLAEMVAALALPAVPESRAALSHARANFMQGLTQLESDWTDARLARERAPLRELAYSNFLLAYQGENDLELQVRFARLIERAAALAMPTLALPPAVRRSARIGVLSSSWRHCTVGSYFGGWIGWLRDASIEVHLYQLGPRQDALTASLAARATQFRLLDGSLEAIAQQLRDDDLDLLLYPELGIDARLVPLAALRLARRQAVAWGHPVTSGFSSIDDFVSCAAMEPADAAAHYRERLVGLPGLGVEYAKPPAPPPSDAAALGLDPARPRILVPQSLFKLHPDGDAVLASIAAAVPQVQFVCFAPERARWWPRFQQRLERAFEEQGCVADRHLVLQPLGTRERFLQVNRACDLMLDSLHWSGGNTALDALCSGLPLVTCPGRFMRGRQSHAMLQRLGLAEVLSCATPQAQAGRVVELLQSEQERRALSGAIGARLPDLFEFATARAAFLDWVRQAVEA